MLAMNGAMAEFERGITFERLRESIAKAKTAGKCKGRAPVSEEKIEQVAALKAQGMKATNIPKQLSLGCSTVYCLLKEAAL